MKHKISSSLYFLFLLLFSGNIFAEFPEKINESSILIDTVSVSQNVNQEFTTNFTIKINSKSFNDWQLGFFSFRFFDDPNSQIKMQICDENMELNCSSLKIEKNLKPTNYDDYRKPDLTSGYLTVLAPVNPFPLNSNKNYSIILSGVKWIPQNISAMPQGFFINSIDDNKVFNINVSHYINKSFDSLKAELDLKNHIKLNWGRSIPYYGNDDPIVPLPVYLKKHPEKGSLDFKDIKNIYYSSNEDLQNAKFLEQALIQDLLLNDIHIFQGKNDSGINFLQCYFGQKCFNIKNKEGYLIDILINKNNMPLINIYSNSPAGGFYAFQTLRQLWNSNSIVSSQTIMDYPRFSYRGFSLDVARHFFTVGEIKKLLDVMGAHKLNTLHFHLSDDEGWRIEVDGFPELTDYGSKRFWGYGIAPAYLIDGKVDISNYLKIPYVSANIEYNGYYTKRDIQELISYANERQITIIPEIEMPGHARAMIKSSATKFADPNDLSVYFGVQGYNDNVLPICRYTFNDQFKQNINLLIQNVSNLFKNQTTQYANSQEISLSGDEVSPDALTNYVPCRISPWKSMDTSLDKSHYFFQLVSQDLPDDIKISGWQQIVQNDDGSIPRFSIPYNKIGHTWAWMPTNNLGLEMASQLIKNKYPTVISFADYSYFDIAYTTQWDEPGLLWATTFSDTYKSLSLGAKIEEIPNHENIIGLEAALWSEAVPSLEHMMYMILPKMSGLAEASWSPLPENDVKINWQSLAMRLGNGQNGFLNYLNRVYQVRYRGYPNGIKLEVPEN